MKYIAYNNKIDTYKTWNIILYNFFSNVNFCDFYQSNLQILNKRNEFFEISYLLT